MIPITSFPRRFATASKQVRYKVKALRATSTWKFPVAPYQQSPLNLQAGTRMYHVQAPSQQSFLSTAAQSTDDEDDEFVGDRSESWYTTDCNPYHGNVPGQLPDGSMTCLPLPNLKTITRQEALDCLDNAWCLTDVLFSGIQGESTFSKPPYHGLRHPMMFYYGHCTVFYINKLRLAGLIDEPLNEYYEEIFEVGVDEMSWDDLSKNEMLWPKLDDVIAYRRQAYRIIKKIILESNELNEGHECINEDSKLWQLFMAIEHDHIHLETSSVLLREMPLTNLKKPKFWPETFPLKEGSNNAPVEGRDYPKNEFIEMDGGKVVLGKDREYPTFSWDNAYGKRELDVPPFKASKFMVSNGEFWDFVKDDGYHDESLWTEEGWKWRSFRNAKWPYFWQQHGPAGLHQYKLRLMFDVVQMQWDWPVEINHHEAKAYCKWKAKKDDEKMYHLTTEPIHQLLRGNNTSDVDDVMHAAGRMADSHQMNLNLSYSSSSPVDAFPPNANGFHDVMGNSWELCEDNFCALPGFRVHPHYPDFSSPCFDGEHNIIMGGSFLSCGENGASKYARFHFRKHFLQFSGLRLIKPIGYNKESMITSCLDAPGPYSRPNPYRTSKKTAHTEITARDIPELALSSAFVQNDDNMVFQDLFTHVNAPERVAKFAVESFKTYGQTKSNEPQVLDVGCGAGGIAFELTKGFTKVEAIDLNETLIHLADELRSKGSVAVSDTSVSLGSEVEASSVDFHTADAMNIGKQYANIDTLIAYRILDQLNDPLGFISQVESVVAPGGILILGTTQDSSDFEHALNAGFELVQEQTMPAFDRDAEDSCRVSLVQTSAWRRRA